MSDKKEIKKFEFKFKNGEIIIGRGKNEETAIKDLIDSAIKAFISDSETPDSLQYDFDRKNGEIIRIPQHRLIWSVENWDKWLNL